MKLIKLRRDIRYPVESTDSDKNIRFQDFHVIERTCPARDFSRTGISFFMEDGSLTFRIGDIIRDLFFISHKTEIHCGTATIMHIQDENKAGKVISRIGCRIENYIDIPTVITDDKITRVKSDYLAFIHSLSVEDNLDQEFVNQASHFQYLLSNFMTKLKHEEEGIRQEEEAMRLKICDALRTISFDAISSITREYCEKFNSITCKFQDSKQHHIHRSYFQKMLNQFFMASSFFRRAYTKPLGYPEDFELINIAYRNSYEGDSLFSQIMNKVDCEGPIAQGIRTRIKYLSDKVTSLYNTTPASKACKILSVNCGPCLEIYEALLSIQRTTKPVSLEIIAMDPDPAALQDARQRLTPLTETMGNVSVKYYDDSIKSLITDKNANQIDYSQSDLIYVASLCDYLSPGASSRLIEALYNDLNPGGTLVVCSLGLRVSQRIKMEYGADWVFAQRSEDDMIDLTEGLPENACSRLEKAPEELNFYLNINKPDA